MDGRGYFKRRVFDKYHFRHNGRFDIENNICENVQDLVYLNKRCIEGDGQLHNNFPLRQQNLDPNTVIAPTAIPTTAVRREAPE